MMSAEFVGQEPTTSAFQMNNMFQALPQHQGQGDASIYYYNYDSSWNRGLDAHGTWTTGGWGNGEKYQNDNYYQGYMNKDTISSSPQFYPKPAPGMIVGLPQVWPVQESSRQYHSPSLGYFQKARNAPIARTGSSSKSAPIWSMSRPVETCAPPSLSSQPYLSAFLFGNSSGLTTEMTKAPQTKLAQDPIQHSVRSSSKEIKDAEGEYTSSRLNPDRTRNNFVVDSDNDDEQENDLAKTEPDSVTLPPPTPSPPPVSVIPEVGIPAPLCLIKNGIQLSNSAYVELLQKWCDYEYKNKLNDDGELCESTSDIVARLTNEVFLDNDEQLFILLTDVETYPATSKPEIWFNGGNKSNLNENGKIAYSCLLNVGHEMFHLFLFSPTDITFTVEIMVRTSEVAKEECRMQMKAKKISSLFFHGKTEVSVTPCWSRNSQVIQIRFVEIQDELINEDGCDPDFNTK